MNWFCVLQLWQGKEYDLVRIGVGVGWVGG